MHFLSSAALHHMPPEGNIPFHPCQLAEQGLLLPDRQVVCNFFFAVLLKWSLSNSRKISSWCPEDRWVASGGDNMVCSCCKTRCDQHGRRKRQTASFAHQVELEGMVSLGPITLEESVMEVELPSPVHLRQTQESRPADEATRFTSKLKQNLSSGSSMQLTGQMPLVFPVSYWSMALLCGTSVATAALILTVAAFCHKTQKMDGHDVPTWFETIKAFLTGS